MIIGKLLGTRLDILVIHNESCDQWQKTKTNRKNSEKWKNRISLAYERLPNMKLYAPMLMCQYM